MSDVVASPPRDAALAAEMSARIEAVRARVAAACARVGRQSASVTIVGVTKQQPPEVVRALADAGVADIGENRVQELLGKMGQVHGVRWHLVGQLQRNKARAVVGRAVLIHAVDRRALVDEIAKRAAQANVVQRILIQVDLGGGAGRGGCPPDDVLDLIAHARRAPQVTIEGLMCVAPLPAGGGDPGEAARPAFAHLRALRDAARARWPEVAHLSMGMSDEYEVAVEEGATMLRLGTVLLGPRAEARREP